MPTIEFKGETIECEEGEILRDVLQDAGLSPHNGLSKYLNCRGRGACGTCAVQIEGDIGSKTKTEMDRMGSAPFEITMDLRLSCQVEVTDDIVVTKHDGFFGHKLPEEED